jgi:hypothetical protein
MKKILVLTLLVLALAMAGIRATASAAPGIPAQPIALDTSAKDAPTAVPAAINYQGRLVDAEGKPLSGDHALSFKIFAQATEGNAVWGPQLFAQVHLVNGHFNIILGPTDTKGDALADAFTNNPDTWLQITVDDSPLPIMPRQKILSAPYAIQAEQAEHAQQAERAYALNGAVTVHESAPLTGTFPITVSEWTEVTTLRLENVQMTGRPVLVTMQSVAAHSYFGVKSPNANVYISVRRDGVSLGTYEVLSETDARMHVPPCMIWLDHPAAGQCTYSVWLSCNSSISTTGYLAGVKLVAHEL